MHQVLGNLHVTRRPLCNIKHMNMVVPNEPQTFGVSPGEVRTAQLLRATTGVIGCLLDRMRSQAVAARLPQVHGIPVDCPFRFGGPVTAEIAAE